LKKKQITCFNFFFFRFSISTSLLFFFASSFLFCNAHTFFTPRHHLSRYHPEADEYDVVDEDEPLKKVRLSRDKVRRLEDGIGLLQKGDAVLAVWVCVSISFSYFIYLSVNFAHTW
jgi:hypothetical protein